MALLTTLMLGPFFYLYMPVNTVLVALWKYFVTFFFYIQSFYMECVYGTLKYALHAIDFVI